MNYNGIKTNRAIIILFILLFTMKSSALAPEDTLKSYNILGARLNYGFVFRHSKALPEETYSNPIGYQLDFSWHFVDKNATDYCNCYPKVGFSFYYWDFRNPNILGHGMNLLVFAEPFINAHNRVSFSFRAGLGVSYLDKPYHETENPLNLCYSTTFSYVVILNFTANFRINDQLLLNLATNYNHISNGGVKMPNKGLNYPSISAGLDYTFQKSRFTKIRSKERDPDLKQKPWRKDIGISLGFRGITEDDNLYYVKGIFGIISRQITNASALTAGLEYIYDGAEYARSKIYTDIEKSAANKFSAMGGYEYLLGKLTLSIQIGAYIISPSRTDPFLYQRYGVRVQLFKNFFTGLNLKSQGHVADFFDIRLGISF